MNIKTNSWMLWLIRSTYGIEKWNTDKYPKSLCTFFWEFVGALVLLPFTFMLHIVNYILKDTEVGAWFGVGIMPLIYGMMTVIMRDWFGIMIVDQFGKVGSYFIFAPIGLVLVIIAITVLILMGFGIKKVVELIKEGYKTVFPSSGLAQRSAKENKPSLVWEFVKAKKRKICPLIEYID